MAGHEITERALHLVPVWEADVKVSSGSLLPGASTQL